MSLKKLRKQVLHIKGYSGYPNNHSNTRYSQKIKGEKTLNIAVLSGKGGTGKTTVSVNLAKALKASYIDCDVEEPNGFIFLDPHIAERHSVQVETPFINTDECSLCLKCIEACQFNALLNIKKEIVILENLCHSCGACKIACQFGAMNYKLRETGEIEKGKSGDTTCIAGNLNIGEPMAGPIIRKLMKQLPKNLNIIDCSPGTSCNVVHTLKDADGAILVTEPTLFGLHDLKMAVELVKSFQIPFGIIINKDDGKNNIIKEFCEENKMNLLGTIPYSKEIAHAYSKGEILYDVSKYKEAFDVISKKVKEVL